MINNNILNISEQILLNGIVWGVVVMTLTTLIKSGLDVISGKLHKNHRKISIFLDKIIIFCNSCSTFWITLIITFNIFSASVAWIVALIVQKLKE